MSALVFGSERANTMVATWKRYDAMTDEEKAKHSPQAIEQKLRAVAEEIKDLELQLRYANERQMDLAAELDTWRLP